MVRYLLSASQVWPLENYLTSLCLSFLICKIGMIIIVLSWQVFCEHLHVITTTTIIIQVRDLEQCLAHVSVCCSVMSDSLRPDDCSFPGSAVHGIFQARTLEWVAISSSRGSSRPRDGTQTLDLLHWQVDSLPTALPGKPNNNNDNDHTDKGFRTMLGT